jgi:hypothetical protein
LYVAADGPRPDRSGEQEACSATRAAFEAIDWPCEVKTLFRPTNLGVRRAVSEAISWFFDHEEAGVILEEDCLPSPDFFPYCAELLERYRDDPKVLQISGTNFQPKARTGGSSYFFSKYNHVWGWATWRRAWKLYRPNLEGLDQFLDDADHNGFWANRKERIYWHKTFRWNLTGRVESWAYRWTYTLWAEGGVCIYPEVNLVSNVGFGPGATNTNRADPTQGNRPTGTLTSLVHPAEQVPNRKADRWTFQHLYWGTPRERFQHRLLQVSQLLWIPMIEVMRSSFHLAR